MRESDIRDYLRQTQGQASEAERRLERLQDLRLQILTRRRGYGTSAAMHATGSVASAIIIRRAIRQQAERVSELQNEVALARYRLEELEEESRRDEAEKERQREEQRRRDEEQRAELEADLEAERQQKEQAQQQYQEVAQAMEAERTRAAELEAELSDEREAREEAERALEKRGRESSTGDPGRERGDGGDDDDGPDPMGATVDRGPRGPEPDSGGGAAEPPAPERHQDHEAEADEYEREM